MRRECPAASGPVLLAAGPVRVSAESRERWPRRENLFDLSSAVAPPLPSRSRFRKLISSNVPDGGERDPGEARRRSFAVEEEVERSRVIELGERVSFLGLFPLLILRRPGELGGRPGTRTRTGWATRVTRRVGSGGSPDAFFVCSADPFRALSPHRRRGYISDYWKTIVRVPRSVSPLLSFAPQKSPAHRRR